MIKPPQIEATVEFGRPRGACPGPRLQRGCWPWAGGGPGRLTLGCGAQADGSAQHGPAQVRAEELALCRAEVMRRLYPKLSSWRATPMHVERLTAVYADLSAAADLGDLERRVRLIEDGGGVARVHGAAPSWC